MIDFDQEKENTDQELDQDIDMNTNTNQESPPPQSDDDTISIGTNNENENESEMSWEKCQGRNTWCNGFCLPYSATATTTIADGDIDILEVFDAEDERAKVIRNQHCILAMQMWSIYDRKRREMEREGSERRRERVRRIKRKKGEFRVKTPWWKRCEVYTSSPLAWDKGFWRGD